MEPYAYRFIGKIVENPYISLDPNQTIHTVTSVDWWIINIIYNLVQNM